jgi:hypothetical protein
MSTADLLALALDHRIRAERATSPAEQLQLHRVADIYVVLATIDVPAATIVREADDQSAVSVTLQQQFETKP